ncbi:TetR/AcrR family transcriptional regulator [Sphaerisporangium rhizosphaerae]|uniref:TetR/AcrR family transcriptional regulator n=1 Tax=Sphaerisporangium rhizosphaerae TaxID=2269375 RepID=A0ABW2NZ10_9ACTN
MGRRPQREIRERLLAACTEHVLAHGLASGLPAMAATAATSPRMLVYHFGTRERLLREVLEEARRRQLQLFHRALSPQDEPYEQTLARAWVRFTGPEGAPFLRLFGTVHDDPGLWPEFRQAATTDWLPVLEQGLRARHGDDAPALATTALAVIRGLLLDRDATGDIIRTDTAFTTFLRLLTPTRAEGDGDPSGNTARAGAPPARGGPSEKGPPAWAVQRQSPASSPSPCSDPPPPSGLGTDITATL